MPSEEEIFNNAKSFFHVWIVFIFRKEDMFLAQSLNNETIALFLVFPIEKPSITDLINYIQTLVEVKTAEEDRHVDRNRSKTIIKVAYRKECIESSKIMIIITQ